MSVSVEFKRSYSSSGKPHTINTACGAKVFMEDGTEITDIVALSMPDTKPDNLLCVTLTIPIHDIKFVD